VVIWCC